MEILLLHLLGDYITQSDWMANNKTSSSVPAAVHAMVYSLPFLLLRPSLLAFAMILGTHFLIDRFRLAKYVVWAKNYLAPYNETWGRFGGQDDGIWLTTNALKYKWSQCKDNFGYPKDTPVFLSMWLMIIADNTLHLGINYLSLKYL